MEKQKGMSLEEKREALFKMEELLKERKKLSINFSNDNNSMFYREISLGTRYHYQTNKSYPTIDVVVTFERGGRPKIMELNTNTTTYVLKGLLNLLTMKELEAKS